MGQSYLIEADVFLYVEQGLGIFCWVGLLFGITVNQQTGIRQHLVSYSWNKKIASFMGIIIFVGLFVVVCIYAVYNFNRYTDKFNNKIAAHYESLGYEVLSIKNPKGFDVKNPFLIEVASPALIIPGVGAITNKITIVKRLQLIKDENPLIVWVRLTVYAKDMKFESQPNIENG